MKRGTPEHPKTRALVAILHIPIYSAVGILELLWHFTADYAPRGDVGRFSDEAIARAVGWHGSASRLVDALHHAGYLDPDPEYRWVIHDWHMHADRAVLQKLERKRLTFAVCTQNTHIDTQSTHINTLPEPEPVHKPEPEPIHSAADAAVLELSPPNGTGKKRRAQKPTLNGTSPEFEEFYALYPRKKAPGAAWNAYQKATRLAEPSVILEGMKRLLPSLEEQDPQYQKHPASWLNARCWQEPTPAPPKPKHDEWDDL